jgi:ribose transport system permease protein
MTLMRLRVKFPLFLTFILLLIICGFASPYFFTEQNVWVLLRQTTIIGIISLGMTFVIIAAGIDLSVGSTVALVSVVSVSCQIYGLPAMILAGLFVGVLVGLVNGLAVTFGRVVPFIATLATMTIAKGLALWYTNENVIFGTNDQFSKIGNGCLALGYNINIPYPVIIFIIIFIFSWLLLEKTVFGKYVRAIGGNTESARRSGVNIFFWTVIAYLYCSFLTSISGIIVSARMNTGSPSIGDGYELDAIASVVIGGTSLFGGKGKLSGTLIGILLFAVIANIMNLLNWPSFIQYTIKGVVLLAAMVFQRFSYSK